MPFTPEDADKHKKGMSAKGKKQWARIAESVRKKEMKKGMSEEDAAVSAIKQANGVVNTNTKNEQYSVYKNKPLVDYEAKLVVHQNKPYLVVPVVMMVEGVHSGNMGPLLHKMEELGKFPASWNGIPVVINHPEEDEQQVSANAPAIIDNVAVGRVYNTEVDGTKLKAEVWLDEDKLNEISPETLADINNNKAIEVSIGAFTENIDEEGSFGGDDYIGIATNHRPDHLAILPDAIGACSCADGCGIGANEKNKIMTKENVKKRQDEAVQRLSANASKDYVELIKEANEALRVLDKYSSDLNKEYAYHYLTELHDDYLIFEVQSRGDTRYYKQIYEIGKVPSNEGDIVLTGLPVEVEKTVTYVTMSENKQNTELVSGKLESKETVPSTLVRTKFRFSINNKNEKGMAEECKPCIKKKVDELITNGQGRWTEGDREMLQTLSELMLDKIAKPVEVIKEVEKVKEVQVNVLSKEDQEALATYKKEKKEKREQVIQNIQANTSKEQWPNETLNGMSDDTLKRLFDSVKKAEEVDYSLMGEGKRIQANASAEEVLLPTGMELETVK